MEVFAWLPGEADLLYHELYVQGAYTHPRIDYAKARMIVDVGANIGMFAVRAMELAPRAKVLSIEPVNAVYKVLSSNLRKFGGADRGVAVNCGVAQRRTRTQFRFHPNFSIWSTANADFDHQRRSFLNSEAPGAFGRIPAVAWLPGVLRRLLARWLLTRWNEVEMVDVELVPLSEVHDQQGVTEVDVLKVDVEGHELEVLRSIRDDHWAGIRQVVMEVENKQGLEEVRSLLRGRGFEVEARPSGLKELIESSELVDLFAWRP